MDYTLLIAYIGISILFVNSIIYAKALRFKSKAFKIFTIFLVSTLLIQIILALLSRVFHKPNLFLSHIFLIVQFTFLSLFYEKLLKNRLIIYILFGGLIFLIIQYLNNLELLKVYNALGITITQTTIVIYSIIYFYKSLNKKAPEFLIVNIGLLIYLISSTLIFASGNLAFNIKIPMNTYKLLFKANGILYIIFQILIFIEWRKNYYKKTLRS